MTVWWIEKCQPLFTFKASSTCVLSPEAGVCDIITPPTLSVNNDSLQFKMYPFPVIIRTIKGPTVAKGWLVSDACVGWIMLRYAAHKTASICIQLTTDGLEAIWKERKLILNNEIIVVTQVVLHVDRIVFTYISFTPVMHPLTFSSTPAVCHDPSLTAASSITYWYLALLLWVIVPQ